MPLCGKPDAWYFRYIISLKPYNSGRPSNHPLFFFFQHLHWSITALQWCVSLCFITKWISYTYTYIPISPPSCVSLPPSLSHPSRPSQSTELISLCYVAASCICPWHSLTLSQLTLPPPRVLTSILYVCVFIPVLPLGSSEPFFSFFFRFHIYVLAYGICFSLSELLHSVWQTLGPSTSLQMTQFHFFLWLSNIPLYICVISSLSIHLLMDT